MTESRFCAYKVLLAVCNNSEFSPRALDDVINNSNLSSQDIALVSNIVYGTLEKERFLDECINHKLKSSKKIDKKIRIILRMSLYQMLYCDKVPKYSAINEGVELAKKINKPLSGFVNAVLRNVDREGIDDFIPNKEIDYQGYLSIKYSVSDYISELFIRQFGNDAESILKAFEGRPAITAKVNTCKISTFELIDILSKEGVNSEISSYFDDVLVLTNTGSIESLESFQKGLFHIQDLASVICCSLLNPKKGETIYDFCSAPGGKSFTIAEMMGNCGRIVSCDISEKKVKMISQGAERLGLEIIYPYCRDAVIGEVLPKADKVLCDVPCSGFGVISKKPEIRNKNYNDVKSLPEIQYSILEHSSLSVKKGGVLVYSTCTLNTNENEAVTNRFLKEHKEFSPFDFSTEFSIKNDWRLTLRPDIHKTDGFFVARMVKND